MLLAIALTASLAAALALLLVYILLFKFLSDLPQDGGLGEGPTQEPPAAPVGLRGRTRPDDAA